jgi:ABC-2 type transport system permease protein
MLNLLRIEWLKVKNYGAFKILSIFFAVGVVCTNFIVFTINKNIVEKSPAGAMLSSFSPYNFSNTWQTTSYATGYLLILPAMLIMMLITNEYTFRTNRQNVIDGWSRHEFISVKLVMALIFAIVSTLLVFFTAISFGFASGTDFSTNGFSHVGYFFLKALSYNMFAVLISVLIKRTGFAIGIFFIYLGAENILSQFLDFWSVKLKMDKTADLGSLGDYLPMNAADGLLTFPDNPLKSLAKGTLPTDYTWLVLGFAIAYLLLFIWWSRNKYMKADL